MASNVFPLKRAAQPLPAPPEDMFDTSGKTMAELKASVVRDAKLKIHLEAKRIAQLGSIREALECLNEEAKLLAQEMQP